MSESAEESPLDALSHENETSQSLIERLAEAGAQLRTGDDVPGGEIAAGLRLLRQYRSLHARRMDDGLLPEARPVAMPGCFEHLDRTVKDHAEHAALIDGLLRDVEGTTSIEPGRRPALGQRLEELASRLYDDVHHEDDYPLSCLVPMLPDDAAGRLAAKYATDAGERGDLDAHIHHYLDRPLGQEASDLAVACAHPGCAEHAAAQMVPARGGLFGIRAPPGWTAAASRPTLEASGKVRLRVEFACPAHAQGEGKVSAPERRVPTAHEAKRSGSPTAPCCGPVEESPTA